MIGTITFQNFKRRKMNAAIFSRFLSLSKDVLAEILSAWLELKSLVRIDAGTLVQFALRGWAYLHTAVSSWKLKPT